MSMHNGRNRIAAKNRPHARRTKASCATIQNAGGGRISGPVLADGLVALGKTIDPKPAGKSAKRRANAKTKKHSQSPIVAATTTQAAPTAPTIAELPPQLLLPAPVAFANAKGGAQGAKFPLGLVAPPALGVSIKAVAMPKDLVLGAAAIARVQPARAKPVIPKKPEPLPKNAPPMLPNAIIDTERHVPALPLPATAEPLIEREITPKPAPAQEKQDAPSSSPDDRSYFVPPASALPRQKSLAGPSQGLVGAIGAWLSSMGKLLASGFIVTKTRKRSTMRIPPVQAPRPNPQPTRQNNAPPNMRERTEMVQLRAENRRLRAQLEAIEAMRKGQAIPRWSERISQEAD